MSYVLRPHQTAHNKGLECSFKDCDRAAFCRAVCKMHYRRWKSLRTRVMQYVKKGPPNECWEWSGLNQADGRPCIYHRGIENRAKKSGRVKTHALRLIKILEQGPLGEPLDEEVGHLCHNSWCVNPNHGKWMTHSENMAMEADGKWHERRGLAVPLEN